MKTFKHWMKDHEILTIFIIIISILALFSLFIPEEPQTPIQSLVLLNSTTTSPKTNSSLEITEPQNQTNEKKDFYASVIDDYDIVFIQEIRNKDQTAFPKLCVLLPEYACAVSSRSGRSTSKEQYGIIYKDSIEIESIVDYNPDSLDRWERPPIEVVFDINGYDIKVYNIHTKPDDVQQEINYLEDVVSNEGNVIILGDLNADCSYYDNNEENEFDSWTWIIGDNEDTTSSSTNCAYDRIILNSGILEEYSNYGVYSQGISKEISDHYLIWIEVNLLE